jgi:hypothetical protein
VTTRRAGPFACAGAVLLSSLALSGADARAAPLTVRLDYAAGPGCPDAAEFKAVVIARLGHDPFVESAPDQVLVRIEPGERTIDGRIEWRDANGQWAGEQTFPSVSTDCPRLVRVMGFALAVQIQLLAKAAAAPDSHVAAPAEAASPPEPPTAKPTQPVATPAPPEGPTVAAAAGRPLTPGPRPTFGVGAGPAVGFGMASAPVLLGRLFGVVAWPRVSVELGAVASLPATTRRADGAGFSQQHLLGSAAGCATATRWNGCVVVNAGAVRMAGQNIDRPTSAIVPIVETGIRAGVVQRVGSRALLGAHAAGLVNVTRWTGTLDQVPVWTAPRFAGTLGIDAIVEFP